MRAGFDADVIPACFQTHCTTNKKTNVSQIVFRLFNKPYGCPAGGNRDTWVYVEHPSLPGGSIQVLCPQYNFLCENEATEAWTLSSCTLNISWGLLIVAMLFISVFY